jgi:hypothetical protein
MQQQHRTWVHALGLILGKAALHKAGQLASREALAARHVLQHVCRRPAAAAVKWQAQRLPHSSVAVHLTGKV